MGIRHGRRLWHTWLLAALIVLWATVPARAAGERTMAIWDFDNNTMGDLAAITAQDYLTRAIPEMILARLNQIPGVKMVERVHLKDALEELKLGSGQLADQDSRLKLGKILGAKEMIFGGFLVLGPTLRIDARVVEVETSLTLAAEAVTGQPGEVVKLADQLADTLAKKVAKAQPATKAGPSGDAALWAEYDKGIKLMDERKFDQAVGIFQAILKAHPDFKPAERQITLAVERMARQ